MTSRFARVVAAAVSAVWVLCGCGGDEPNRAAAATATPTPPPELPGGGRVIFHDPVKRVVAFYGHPGDPELGTLGIGTPTAMAARLRKVAAQYRTRRRPVLPAMELLATTATADEGDGLHRQHTSPAVIDRYLGAARRAGALLILDIQPGRSDFLTEARRLERWLREPDVGLALDPEWRVGPDDVPGRIIGSVDAREVVAVGLWLDELTARYDLPQKLLLVHQFTEGMITSRELLRPYAHVAFVLNTDGFGDQPNKIAKYRAFAKLSPSSLDGFKLFYREDIGLMTPRQVLRLRPSPDVIIYE